MKDARFTIPMPALLSRVVDMLDDIPMQDRDTKSDLYEYMLSKIATAGQNGQSRTPRHIISLMVEMTAPGPKDEICDPACGTAGFLVATGEHVRREHPAVLLDAEQGKHFHQHVRLRRNDAADREHEDAAARRRKPRHPLPRLPRREPQWRGGAVLPHSRQPAIRRQLDYESTSKDLQRVVKTKKTEPLFLALFLKLLKPGGRAAVIVPDGVLFGSSKAHKELRRILVEDQKLDGVVKR